jgi:hypothetical protein
MSPDELKAMSAAAGHTADAIADLGRDHFGPDYRLTLVARHVTDHADVVVTSDEALDLRAFAALDLCPTELPPSPRDGMSWTLTTTPKDPSTPEQSESCDDAKLGASSRSDEGAAGSVARHAELTTRAGNLLVCSALLALAEHPEALGDPGVRAALRFARLQLRLETER